MVLAADALTMLRAGGELRSASLGAPTSSPREQALRLAAARFDMRCQ
jgi:hypothetical protein